MKREIAQLESETVTERINEYLRDLAAKCSVARKPGAPKLELHKIRRRHGAFGAARRQICLTAAGLFAANPASAQVLIPFGDFNSDFEKYLVATISLLLLAFAMWRFFRNRR